MENKEIKVFEVFFYNAEDETEHEHRYYHNEKNARGKYIALCKKYGVKANFCYTDRNGYTIGYWEIAFND